MPISGHLSGFLPGFDLSLGFEEPELLTIGPPPMFTGPFEGFADPGGRFAFFARRTRDDLVTPPPMSFPMPVMFVFSP